ncbi:sickle tail protein homolog isoform X5 [Oryctolagus cuniculus]|uniref:sickle tail protein homolog isoform X5 n=1 Tax=Oryctolagus cuniculus TaxID=9986 RepID=UPI0038790BBF
MQLPWAREPVRGGVSPRPLLPQPGPASSAFREHSGLRRSSCKEARGSCAARGPGTMAEPESRGGEPRPPRWAHRAPPAPQEPGKSGGLHVTAAEDAECRRTKERPSNGSSRQSSSKCSRNIPRRHTLGGARSSREILGMQTSEMDRKREAFLEHLKQKYPHHATAIMGHQERLRDQALRCMLTSLQGELDIQRYLMKIESSQRTRSPKLCHSPQPPSSDPVEHLSEASADSLEAMSEGDTPSPFSRGSRTRASLPVVRSTNQTKERSLGVLYVQYGDETKQLRMPNEITSADTIRALFVSAFPQQLTMKMLESPSVAIYIKDESRNVYYELNDVRNIQDRSLLKVYNKDPAHVFNHTPKTMNGDARMQREMVYARGEGPGASRPGSMAHPAHAIPSSPPSTPVPHSMPPSPSRIPYGGSRPMMVPGNATIPRDRLSSLPVSRSISPSPSAILERRDVKPDEDLGGKNLAMYRNEGLYADPYLYHDGRMSIASSHGGHPLDVPDHIVAYHRTAIRSASAYCNPSLQAEMHMEQALYRQKPRKYPDSQLPTLGAKTPPASPHRVGDLRMLDLPAHGAHGLPHTLQPDRASPSRQSFKKEPGTLVYLEKPRNLPGFVDLGPPLVEKQVFTYSTATIPKDRETRERMQAMEKQIASLTGLVQSALFKGSITSNYKDATSEKMMRPAASRSHTDGAGTPHIAGGKTLGALEPAEPLGPPVPAGASAVHLSLLDMRRGVAELRRQLQQMRQLQLQNQELLRTMIKKAELEISSKVAETMRRLEDPVQRQRTLVEQERQKYLREEGRIGQKLSELEEFVDDLKKEPTATGRAVTLKDVEDGAFLLRQVGEAVAALKGEFPTLQNKMRAVLRIEVEAVRFLKEEPHKLDGLLKRVRGLTDVLTVLRRHVTDGLLKGADAAQAAHYMAVEKATAAEVLRGPEEAGGPARGDAKPDVVPLTGQQAQSPPGPLAEDARTRAAAVEKVEKKWEEKRPNPDHYNGKEFEKLLEEAQANIMKSIPNLEMPPAPGPPPRGEGTVDKLELSEDSPNSEQGGKSPPPPPPPPRRSYLPGTGLTTTRSGDVVYTSRKETVTAKASSEDAGPSPQTRATRCSTEEPASAWTPASPAVTASPKDEEEEEEGDKIMAELQSSELPHEDAWKSELARPHGPHTASPQVAAGALSPGGAPSRDTGKNGVPDASTAAESKPDVSGKESSIPGDARNFQKRAVEASLSVSSVSSLEDERSKRPAVAGPQLPTPGLEPQNYGKTQEREQERGEHTGRAHVPSLTPATELAQAPGLEAPPTGVGQVVLRPKGARHVPVPPAENGDPTPGPPSEGNIAFMITRTAVQALSSGEVQDIVSRKGEEVQTVTIDGRREGPGPEEPVVCLDRKPVIIIFDEPMDIRSAYKRLSTIFEECDEELERMMTEEKIEEEEEEENGDPVQSSSAPGPASTVASGTLGTAQPAESPFPLPSPLVAGSRAPRKADLNESGPGDALSPEGRGDAADEQFDSPKKKFKFKFPKKQLAALTQAIRTGTRTGKKTLQVVVYEEEEEDGTLKQHKEARRFEIPSSQPEGALEGPAQSSRTEEIRKNTYRTLDSLEQTIKQLENTISEMSPRALADSAHAAHGPPPHTLLVRDDVPTAPEPPTPVPPAPRKGSGGTPQTSRMPVPLTSKSRPGSLDKAGKPSKLQDPRQYRQANGSAKKAGGDFKPTSPSLPASKIPALSPSSGKSGSLPSSGDGSSLPNAPAPKPSAASNPLSPSAGRPAPAASLIPSASNGASKLAHAGKGQHLPLPPQTHNGRAAPPAPSASPASPPSLSHGAKGARTLLGPGLAGYKAQNGGSSKTAPVAAKESA